MKFKSIVKKGNNKGACFVILPTNTGLNKSDTILIKINDYNVKFYAKTRIYYNKLGFYIPANIAIDNNLFGKTCIFSIEKTDGFFTKTSDDGRIYLPQQKAEKLKLKQNEIVLIEAIINKEKYSEFCQVKIRKKPKTTEYFCMFNPNIIKKEGVFNIKSIISRRQFHILILIKHLIEGFNYGSLDKNKIILYYGNRVPISVNTQLYLKDIAYYLGCYFSDGTKKGNSWGICASTFEQANFFIKMHKALIKNPFIKVELTYTDPHKENEDLLRTRLSNIWLQKTEISILKKKIWIYKTEAKDAHNRNKYGALSIREHRQLVLLYYVRLLNHLIKIIVEEKNIELAIDFVCGVLEGDGCPSAKQRGHIVISSNKKEVKTLIKVFKVLNFNHKGYHEKENKCSIRIGSTELIENILLFKDKLFKYYPKRRRRTIDRLLRTGAAMFLMGISTTTSHWILKRFREKEILNKDNKLTAKGKKIKKALLELSKEINLNL